MRIGVRSLTGQVALWATLAAAASCSGSSPVGPGLSSSATGGGATSRSTDGVMIGFPLERGSLVIASSRGHQIVGSYVGTALLSGEQVQTSTLTVQISDGSGAFAGAAGTIVIQGTGAFADEGEFVLEGRGDLTVAGGRRKTLALSLRGLSRASCGNRDLIAISQSATGAMGHAGRVTATLTHEVGSTSCSSVASLGLQR